MEWDSINRLISAGGKIGRWVRPGLKESHWKRLLISCYAVEVYTKMCLLGRGSPNGKTRHYSMACWSSGSGMLHLWMRSESLWIKWLGIETTTQYDFRISLLSTPCNNIISKAVNSTVRKYVKICFVGLMYLGWFSDLIALYHSLSQSVLRNFCCIRSQDLFIHFIWKILNS